MRSITTIAVLILTISMVFGGITSNVYAQNSPGILLTIAKRAENQIENQITNSSDELKQLFEDGKDEVKALEESLATDDLDSAKKHFLASMKIFTEISRQLASQTTTQTQTTVTQNTVKNPTSDLLRMYGYVNNLKSIAKNQNSSVDFTQLDNLFLQARQQIGDNQYSEATDTIREIKDIIIDINNELRESASQQETNKAQSFAQRYITQIDRLIEHSQFIGKSEEIIQKLKSAKQALIAATTPAEVINEVRNVLFLQQQLELTEGKLLEMRIMQIENTIGNLTSTNQIDPDSLNKINQALEEIKNQTSTNEFEEATESIRSLMTILQEFEI